MATKKKVFIPNTERKAMFSYEIETVTRHSPDEPHMFAPCLFLSFYGRSASFWLERHLFMVCAYLYILYMTTQTQTSSSC